MLHGLQAREDFSKFARLDALNLAQVSAQASVVQAITARLTATPQGLDARPDRPHAVVVRPDMKKAWPAWCGAFVFFLLQASCSKGSGVVVFIIVLVAGVKLPAGP